MNTVIKNLIKRNGGKVMAFRKLPVPAQAAMAFYMSVDGEAWEQAPAFNTDFVKVLPWYRKHYGHEKFGYVEIPTGELMDSIFVLSETMQEEFGDVDTWHRWYLENSTIPDHPESGRWPVILDDLTGTGEDGLQDGWHRFADYVRKGAKKIPALYYPA